jgi:hypothetical protein
MSFSVAHGCFLHLWNIAVVAPIDFEEIATNIIPLSTILRTNCGSFSLRLEFWNMSKRFSVDNWCWSTWARIMWRWLMTIPVVCNYGYADKGLNLYDNVCNSDPTSTSSFCTWKIFVWKHLDFHPQFLNSTGYQLTFLVLITLCCFFLGSSTLSICLHKSSVSEMPSFHWSVRIFRITKRTHEQR